MNLSVFLLSKSGEKFWAKMGAFLSKFKILKASSHETESGF